MAKEGIINTLREIYLQVMQEIPDNYEIYFLLAVYTLVLALYSLFIWKFHKFIGKRDIIELNLRQYNKSEHPFLSKFFASLLFLLEYIIILPAIIFIWFSVFSVFLLVLSESQSVNQILLISASIVAAIRLTAYHSTALSKELAKIFPIALLIVLLVEPNFFSFDKIISRLFEIPSLLNMILVYILFIFVVESFMRVLYTIFQFASSEEE